MLRASSALHWQGTSGSPGGQPFRIPLRRESVPVYRNGRVASYKTTYSGVMHIGGSGGVVPSDAKEFRMVFDTGSGHVVLPSVKCESSTCLAHNRFGLEDSRTACAVQTDGSPVDPGETADQITVGYGTGQIVGEFIRDQVCLGEAEGDAPGSRPCAPVHLVTALEMTEQPFKSFQFDGLFGLGLEVLALTPDFSFMEMFAQGAATPHFAFFLTDDETKQSEFAVGGYDAERLAAPLVWVPAAKQELGHWQVEILEVRINGEKVGACGAQPCHGVVDTGTSHLGVPKSQHELITNFLTLPSGDLADCRLSDAPTVELDLPGITLELGPENYMRKLPLPDGVTVSSRNGVTLPGAEAEGPAPVAPAPAPDAAEPTSVKGPWCRPRLMPVNLPAPLGPNLFILGEPVLLRYYTVFDWGDPHVAFGPLRSAGGRGGAARLRSPGNAASAEEEPTILIQTVLLVRVRRVP